MLAEVEHRIDHHPGELEIENKSPWDGVVRRINTRLYSKNSRAAVNNFAPAAIEAAKKRLLSGVDPEKREKAERQMIKDIERFFDHAYFKLDDASTLEINQGNEVTGYVSERRSFSLMTLSEKLTWAAMTEGNAREARNIVRRHKADEGKMEELRIERENKIEGRWLDAIEIVPVESGRNSNPDGFVRKISVQTEIEEQRKLALGHAIACSERVDAVRLTDEPTRSGGNHDTGDANTDDKKLNRARGNLARVVMGAVKRGRFTGPETRSADKYRTMIDKMRLDAKSQATPIQPGTSVPVGGNAEVDEFGDDGILDTPEDRPNSPGRIRQWWSSVGEVNKDRIRSYAMGVVAIGVLWLAGQFGSHRAEAKSNVDIEAHGRARAGVHAQVETETVVVVPLLGLSNTGASIKYDVVRSALLSGVNPGKVVGMGVEPEIWPNYPMPVTEVSPFYSLGPVNLEQPFSINGKGMATVRVSTSPENVQGLELMSWFNDFRSDPNKAVVFRTNWRDSAVICHSGINRAGNEFMCNWINNDQESLLGQTITIGGSPDAYGNRYSVDTRVVHTYEIGYSEFSQRFSPAQPYTADGLAFFNAANTFDDSGLGLPERFWPENRANGEQYMHVLACKDINGDGIFDVWQAVVLAEIPGSLRVATPESNNFVQVDELPPNEVAQRSPYVQEVEQLRDMMNEYPQLYPHGQDTVKLGDYLRQQAWYAGKRATLSPEQMANLEEALNKLNDNTYRYRKPGTDQWQFTQCVTFIGLLSALGYSEGPVDITRARVDGRSYVYPGELIPDNLGIQSSYIPMTVNNLSMLVGSVPMDKIGVGDLIVSDKHVAAVIEVTDGPQGPLLGLADANYLGNGGIDTRYVSAKQVFTEMATSNGLGIIQDTQK